MGHGDGGGDGDCDDGDGIPRVPVAQLLINLQTYPHCQS